MIAAEEAKKAAEKAALQTGLATTTSERDQLAIEKRQLETEKAQLEADKAALKAERDALAARLDGAVERIMEVRKTARGLAMDLGNVLFDVNKATLKPGAYVPLAKLSGVLLMVPEVNVRIEGFTDATGSAERNKVALRRARPERLRLPRLPEDRPVPDDARRLRPGEPRGGQRDRRGAHEEPACRADAGPGCDRADAGRLHGPRGATRSGQGPCQEGRQAGRARQEELASSKRRSTRTGPHPRPRSRFRRRA